MGFTRDEDSGRLWLDGEAIRYASKTYGDWEVSLDVVRLIGERTNEDGPFADDYFICFLTDANTCYEASFYAEGRDDCLKAIGRYLDSGLDLGLCSSARFASRILWPAELVGQPLLTFTEQPPRGVWSRVLSYLAGGPFHVLQTLSPEALTVLRSRSAIPKQQL